MDIIFSLLFFLLSPSFFLLSAIGSGCNSVRRSERSCQHELLVSSDRKRKRERKKEKNFFFPPPFLFYFRQGNWERQRERKREKKKEFYFPFFCSYIQPARLTPVPVTDRQPSLEPDQTFEDFFLRNHQKVEKLTFFFCFRYLYFAH